MRISKSVDELCGYLRIGNPRSKKRISKICISQYSKNYNLDAPYINQEEYLVIDFGLS
jgi:tRNA threonylcarbamoyladenosine modification (KEOPS) complex Cgi121 subunit